MYTRETLRILEGIDMPKADKEKIWHGNLERITGTKLVQVAAISKAFNLSPASSEEGAARARPRRDGAARASRRTHPSGAPQGEGRDRKLRRGLLTFRPMSITRPIGLSEPDEPPQGGAPPQGEAGRVTPVMEQYIRDQGHQSGLLVVLPDGRFLRNVLRGRRDRLARAWHRAHQARQAPRPRIPMACRSIAPTNICTG